MIEAQITIGLDLAGDGFRRTDQLIVHETIQIRWISHLTQISKGLGELLIALDILPVVRIGLIVIGLQREERSQITTGGFPRLLIAVSDHAIGRDRAVALGL